MKKNDTSAAVKKGFIIRAAAVITAAAIAVGVPLVLYFMHGRDKADMPPRDVICEDGDPIDTDKADDTENGVTAYFELVQYNEEYGSCYVVSEAYGLISLALPENSRDIFAGYERVPSGLTLSVTWSGAVMESYPGQLDSIERVSVMKTEPRPDFMSEHYDALLEACRQLGENADIQAEVDKIYGLTDREREALIWLISCEIFY